MLNLKHCSVRYIGGPPAVISLDLEIGASERVALVGPSGAGKTTIIALANGTVLPTSGRAEILGINSSELGRRQHRHVRAKVATVYQDFALVPSLRVANNVAAGRLGHWSTMAGLKSLLRVSDQEEILEVLTEVGISEKIWDRTDSLSGGQQQRVAIARALFQNPDLLLADEPVSNLDPARSRAVLDVLVNAAAADPARTLIASIHDAPLALSHFDRIVGLKQGRLIFDLPTARVSSERLDQLYRLDDPADSGKSR